MGKLTSFEQEVATLIIDTLNLEGVTPADIDPEAALFREGLGLDSIDALEISLAIGMKYGFQLRSDDSDNVRIFSSLRILSEHVQRNRTR
jgi:acyl carrier protein